MKPQPPPKFLQIQLYNLRKNNDVGKVNLRVDFMIDALIELQNSPLLCIRCYSRSVGIFSQVQYNRISPNQEFLRPPAPTQISMHADD